MSFHVQPSEGLMSIHSIHAENPVPREMDTGLQYSALRPLTFEIPTQYLDKANMPAGHEYQMQPSQAYMYGTAAGSSVAAPAVMMQQVYVDSSSFNDEGGTMPAGSSQVFAGNMPEVQGQYIHELYYPSALIPYPSNPNQESTSMEASSVYPVQMIPEYGGGMAMGAVYDPMPYAMNQQEFAQPVNYSWEYPNASPAMFNPEVIQSVSPSVAAPPTQNGFPLIYQTQVEQPARTEHQSTPANPRESLQHANQTTTSNQVTRTDLRHTAAAKVVEKPPAEKTTVPPHIQHKQPGFSTIATSPFSLYYYDESVPNNVFFKTSSQDMKIRPHSCKRDHMLCGGVSSDFKVAAQVYRTGGKFKSTRGNNLVENGTWSSDDDLSSLDEAAPAHTKPRRGMCIPRKTSPNDTTLRKNKTVPRQGQLATVSIESSGKGLQKCSAVPVIRHRPIQELSQEMFFETPVETHLRSNSLQRTLKPSSYHLPDILSCQPRKSLLSALPIRQTVLRRSESQPQFKFTSPHYESSYPQVRRTTTPYNASIPLSQSVSSRSRSVSFPVHDSLQTTGNDLSSSSQQLTEQRHSIITRHVPPSTLESTLHHRVCYYDKPATALAYVPPESVVNTTTSLEKQAIPYGIPAINDSTNTSGFPSACGVQASRRSQSHVTADGCCNARSSPSTQGSVLSETKPSGRHSTSPACGTARGSPARFAPSHQRSVTHHDAQYITPSISISPVNVLSSQRRVVSTRPTVLSPQLTSFSIGNTSSDKTQSSLLSSSSRRLDTTFEKHPIAYVTQPLHSSSFRPCHSEDASRSSAVPQTQVLTKSMVSEASHSVLRVPMASARNLPCAEYSCVVATHAKPTSIAAKCLEKCTPKEISSPPSKVHRKYFHVERSGAPTARTYNAKGPIPSYSVSYANFPLICYETVVKA